MEKEKLYDKVLKKWGISSQLNMLIEECAELIVAINHLKRKRISTDNLFEECADVSILIEQMEQFYGSKEIEKWKKLKLKRLGEYFTQTEKIKCHIFM